MKRTLTIALVATLALSLGGVAYANYCARDYVPANTLLVPFIKVGMLPGWTGTDPNGATTMFAITNVSQAAQIVHISTYSILSQKFIDFDVVLSGYDVVTINFRDILAGNLAAIPTGGEPDFSAEMQTRTIPGYSYTPFKFGPGYTGLTSNDLGDGSNPAATDNVNGNRSFDRDTATGIATCTGRFPYGTYPEILSVYAKQILRPPLTAWTHPGCSPSPARPDRASDWLSTLNDNEAWLYAYADVVNSCNNDFPTNQTYWTANTTGYMANRNVIIGDVIYLDATHNFSEALPAVSVEYSANVIPANMVNFYDQKTLSADGLTAYNAYSSLEPLPTAFAFRYGNAGPVTSNFILWKNFAEYINFPTSTKVDDCKAYVYYAWDEDEFSVSPGSGKCPYSPCPTAPGETNETPFETQSVPLTSSNFDLAGGFGWMLYIMPPAFAPHLYSSTMTTPYWYMGYAAVQFKYGTYSAALEAATMANTHCFANQVLQPAGQADLGLNIAPLLQ